MQHEWYSFVEWFYHGSAFPETKKGHIRWLGPSMDIGPDMCSKIIKSNGQIINLSSYQAITEEEKQDPTQEKLRDEFDSELIKKLGQSMLEPAIHAIDPAAVTSEHDIYLEKVDGTQDHVPDADELVVTPGTQDNYVGAKVNISFGGTIRSGSVKQRSRDAEGELFGTRNSNIILDTRSYEVEFPDGDAAEFTANMIAENMFS